MTKSSTVAGDEAHCRPLIGTLPDEVLSEIFQLVSSKTSEISLLLVCKWWTQLALSVSSLWTTVTYDSEVHSIPALQRRLEKSRQAPLDLCLFLRSINPYVHDQYAFKLNEVRLSQACDVVRVHLHRTRHLRYNGSLAHLFPLKCDLHYLKTLQIDCMQTSDIPDACNGILKGGLLRSSAPQLDSFSLNSPHDLSHLIGRNFRVDARGLRHLEFPMRSHRNDVARELVNQCDDLRSLEIDLRRTSNNGSDDHLGALRVSELRLVGPIWRLPYVVTSAPKLVHLLLWDPLTFARSVWHDGPRQLHTAERVWPNFPHLRTLSICHPSVAEIIPTMEKSPHIVALHLCGRTGYMRTLQMLNTAISNDAKGCMPAFPLQSLKHLRLWIFPSVWADIDALGQDNWSNVWPALVSLLEVRGRLHVEICSESITWGELPPWDPAEIGRDINASIFGSRVRLKRLEEELYASPARDFKAPLTRDFPCTDVVDELTRLISPVDLV